MGCPTEVEIGDDWSLISRTLHGKTLPFDDLSVGAKEQLGILTRLAAAQIVSKRWKLRNGTLSIATIR